MPNWKRVPKLKTLTIQKLAWPDAVHKSTHAKKQFPTVESYVRNTLIAKYFFREKAKFKTRKKHNIQTFTQPMRDITEDVVNAWIRLSNYYETKLSEIDSMAMFMHLSTIGKLDFLHEGFTLRDEKDFLHKIQPYIGVIPSTQRPQKIDFRTWFDLVNILVQEGVVESLEHLFIPFGNEKVKREKIPTSADLSSPSTYRFEEAFESFVHLKTLVVRGEIIKDNFMLAVGENCYFLEHFDVRGTSVTIRGVGLLLFQKLGKRFFKGAFLPTLSRFPNFPLEILRPCCATLKYLDISEVLMTCNSAHVYDMYVTKACPLLRPTPLKFYYNVPGKTRAVLTDFSDGFGLANFRQQLVNYVKTSQCEQLFEFVQIILGCIHFIEPRLEIMEDEYGEEISFLLLSGSAVVVHCEVANLSTLTLVCYARNNFNFISISVISKFAPNLQKLKASLKGSLTEETAMKHLKYVTAPAVNSIETMISLTEHCQALQYLEVRDILTMDTSKQFGNGIVQEIFPRDPGDYENLEVVRFLFRNRITVHPGLSWIVSRCPSLRIIGDLDLWGIPFDTAMRLFTNTRIHSSELALEYRSILHFCGADDVAELARFE